MKRCCQWSSCIQASPQSPALVPALRFQLSRVALYPLQAPNQPETLKETPPVQGELSAVKTGFLTPFYTMGLILQHAIHCCLSHLPASLLKQAAKTLHPIINKQRSPLVLCCVPEPSCGCGVAQKRSRASWLVKYHIFLILKKY